MIAQFSPAECKRTGATILGPGATQTFFSGFQDSVFIRADGDILFSEVGGTPVVPLKNGEVWTHALKGQLDIKNPGAANVTVFFAEFEA